MEWKVVEALVVIVGLFLTIGRPIIQHTKQTQKMLDQLGNHNTAIKDNAEMIDEHDKKLQNHEMRLHDLEQDQE